MDKHIDSVEYYNKNAEEFYNGSINADMSSSRERFLKYIPDGGRILDAGCGSGRDSKAFIQLGYSVVAFDASREMCKMASELIDQEVWQMRFDEMSFDDEFGGIWACASLLHVHQNEMQSVLAKIKKALIQNGVLYASFKYGNGEIERNDRVFTNYTEDSVKTLLEGAGFEIKECELSHDSRPGRENEMWVNVIGERIS